MHEWWIFNLLIGFGVAQWLIVLLTLPDPPPDPLAWLVRTIAGGRGGVAGGWLAAQMSSDPMPGIVLAGALAGASLLVGAVRTFGGSGAVKR